MKTVYLHIGLHKTGTTSIQRFCSDNKEQLLSLDVLYPDSGRFGESRSRTFGHHELAWKIRGKNRFRDECWSDLREEILRSGASKVVVSSEDFETCNESQIESIRGLLDGFSITVVLYLRNPVDFIISAYKQQVKTGTTSLCFEDFVDKNIQRCDFDSLVGRWRAFLQPDRVNLRVYETAARDGGLLRDFLSSIGLPSGALAAEIRSAKQANVSPSSAELACLLAINRLSRGSGSRLVRRLRSAILQKALAGRALCRLIGPFSEKDLFPPAVLQEINKYFVATSPKTLERCMSVSGQTGCSWFNGSFGG